MHTPVGGYIFQHFMAMPPLPIAWFNFLQVLLKNFRLMLPECLPRIPYVLWPWESSGPHGEVGFKCVSPSTGMFGLIEPDALSAVWGVLKMCMVPKESKYAIFHRVDCCCCNHPYYQFYLNLSVRDRKRLPASNELVSVVCLKSFCDECPSIDTVLVSSLDWASCPGHIK